MNYPANLKYTKEHEWIRLEGDTAFVGISDYAQDSLGDVVYVELPKVGTEVSKGDEIANIESVKAASAIYAPVSGIIESVNSDLDGAPELINQEPYNAFIFSIKLKDPKEIEHLFDSAGYQEFLKTEGH